MSAVCDLCCCLCTALHRGRLAVRALHACAIDRPIGSIRLATAPFHSIPLLSAAHPIAIRPLSLSSAPVLCPPLLFFPMSLLRTIGTRVPAVASIEQAIANPSKRSYETLRSVSNHQCSTLRDRCALRRQAQRHDDGGDD